MFLLERLVNYPEGFILLGEEARAPRVSDLSTVKVSVSTSGDVVLQVTFHPDQVDAVIHGLREAKVEALRFHQEERS
jgi:hypothetical protein